MTGAGTGRAWRPGFWRLTGPAAAVLLAAVLAAGCGAPHRAGGTVHSPAAAARTSAPADPAQHPCTVTAILAPTCGAWWGMYLPTDTGGTGLVAAVAAEQRSLGRPLDIIERYHDFSHGPNGIFPNPGEARLARNHLLLYSWGPAVWTTHTYYRWSTIASGALDRSVVIPEATPAARVRPQGVPHLLGRTRRRGARQRHRGAVRRRLAARLRRLRPAGRAQRGLGVDDHGIRTARRRHRRAVPGQRLRELDRLRPLQLLQLPQQPVAVVRRDGRPVLSVAHGQPPRQRQAGDARRVRVRGRPGEPRQEAAWYRGIVPELRALPRLKALVMWNSGTPGCDLQLSAAPAAARAYRQAGLSPYLRQPLP